MEEPTVGVIARFTKVAVVPSLRGDLELNHILAAAGLNPDDVLVLRHSFKPDGLESRADLTDSKVLNYVRRQSTSPKKFDKDPPSLWLNFTWEPNSRARFLVAYENPREVLEERTDEWRFFDLQPSDALAALKDRLVIGYPTAINWYKRAGSCELPVVEIADPQVVPFPGFDRVLITHDVLQAVINDSRYRDWRAALGAVQGIYLITDTNTGKSYVGKADGGERIIGRWTTYAKDGHGGNAALRELPEDHFQYSILRVFGPSATTAEVNAAESHFKAAMLTRKYGLNRN